MTGLHVVTSTASGEQGVAIAPRVSTQTHTVSVVEALPRAQGTGPMPLLQGEIDRERIASCRARCRRRGCDRDLVAFLELALGRASCAARRARARDRRAASHRCDRREGRRGHRELSPRAAARRAARSAPTSPTFALTPDDVHRALAGAAPRGLLATATHDTKRGEDVRARIAVLSERPDGVAARFVDGGACRASATGATSRRIARSST